MAAPTVRPARYGLLASAVGAAALVLHHELRPMHTGTPLAAARQADSEPLSHTTTTTAD